MRLGTNTAAAACCLMTQSLAYHVTTMVIGADEILIILYSSDIINTRRTTDRTGFSCDTFDLFTTSTPNLDNRSIRSTIMYEFEMVSRTLYTLRLPCPDDINVSLFLLKTFLRIIYDKSLDSAIGRCCPH